MVPVPDFHRVRILHDESRPALSSRLAMDLAVPVPDFVRVVAASRKSIPVGATARTGWNCPLPVLLKRL